MSRWRSGGYQRHSPPPPPAASGGMYQKYYSREQPDQRAYGSRRFDDDYYANGDLDRDFYRSNGGGGSSGSVSHVRWRDYAYSNIYDSNYSGSRAAITDTETSPKAEHQRPYYTAQQQQYWHSSKDERSHSQDRFHSSRGRYAYYANEQSSRYSSNAPPANCGGGGSRARMMVSSSSSGGVVGSGGCLLDNPRVGRVPNPSRPNKRKPLPPPPLSPSRSNAAIPAGQYACRLCKFGTDDVYSLYSHANTAEHIARALQDPAQSLCCRPCNLFASDINDMLDHNKMHEFCLHGRGFGLSEVSEAPITPAPESVNPDKEADAVSNHDQNEAMVSETSPQPQPPQVQDQPMESPLTAPTPTLRPLRLKIRCLPCRQAFSRQAVALEHFTNQTCQSLCHQWWRDQTIANGYQPQSFFAVQCRGCNQKPTFPAFNDDLELHIDDAHSNQRPIPPPAKLLNHLAEVKEALIQDCKALLPSTQASSSPTKPRQMARKTLPRGKRRYPAAPARRTSAAAANAASANATATAIAVNHKRVKRARMAAPLSPNDNPLVGSSCMMAPGYRPLQRPSTSVASTTSVARGAAIACLELDAPARLALVGPAGNGHAGLACLACGRLCPDAAQFWAHASECRQQQKTANHKHSEVCPLCSLTVDNLDAHIARHRRRMLPASWQPGPAPPRRTSEQAERQAGDADGAPAVKQDSASPATSAPPVAAKT